MRTQEQTLTYTDEEIKKDIVNHLSWDSRIDASDITIEVDDGSVTLSGQVPTYTAKHAAAGNAWLVNGVDAVENELEVSYVSSVTIPDDAEIKSNIIDTLRWDPDLLSYKIDVDVSNGWVTLDGTVEAFWEKIHAETKAESVRGVIGVTNQLAVVPTERITDEQIGKDITDALARNIHVNVDDVTVRIEDGEVTLTGTVPTWRAKSAAYDSALYTLGVTEVDNNLVVSPL